MGNFVRGLSALLLVGSCGSQVRVPEAYQGPERLIIENQHQDSVCEMYMTQQSVGYSGKWLRRRLRSGARVEVRVKPGTYDVFGEGCNGRFYVTGSVVVAGPTVVGLGRDPEPVAGFTSQKVWAKWRGGGGGGGSYTPAAAPAPAEERSCTGMCGGPQGQFGSCCPDEGWHCVIDPKDRSDPSATGVCALQ